MKVRINYIASHVGVGTELDIIGDFVGFHNDSILIRNYNAYKKSDRYEDDIPCGMVSIKTVNFMQFIIHDVAIDVKTKFDKQELLSMFKEADAFFKKNKIIPDE